MEPPDPPLQLSVVVPFFNEEEAVPVVVDELGRALTDLGETWEAILVDDGSSDRTGDRLEAARQRWPQIRIIRLPENLGQGPALYRGISATLAPVIVTMDGDGQNLPGDIAPLLAQLSHADLVNGIRVDRSDPKIRLLLSRLANTVRRRLLRDGVRDAGCALKVFRREVAAAFLPLPMLNPFMPALAVAAGFRVAEFPVRHRARASGQSKYGGTRLLARPLLHLLAVWWRLRRSRPPARALAAASKLR